MTDYDWENRSLWSRPVKPPPVRDSHRDRNQRAVLVEHALQRPLGGSDNSADQRFEALSPRLSNAAIGTQRVSGNH
jgi:hypothetical protein